MVVFAEKGGNKILFGESSFVKDYFIDSETLNDLVLLERYQNDLQSDFDRLANEVSSLVAYSPTDYEDMKKTREESHNINEQMKEISIKIAYATMFFRLVDEGWKIGIE